MFNGPIGSWNITARWPEPLQPAKEADTGINIPGRPDYAYTCGTADSLITFEKLPTAMDREALIFNRELTIKIIQKKTDGIDILEKDVIEGLDSGRFAIYFAFSAQAEKKTNYYLIFYILIDRQTLMGTFQCPLEQADTKKTQMFELIKSINGSFEP